MDNQLLVSLISGIAGGNLAGILMKAKSLGPLWNSVLGVLGGGVGGQLLSMTGLLADSGLLANVAGSGVGGGILMLIVSLFRKGK